MVVNPLLRNLVTVVRQEVLQKPAQHTQGDWWNVSALVLRVVRRVVEVRIQKAATVREEGAIATGKARQNADKESGNAGVNN